MFRYNAGIDVENVIKLRLYIGVLGIYIGVFGMGGTVGFFQSNYIACSEWRTFPPDLDHCDSATALRSGLMRPKRKSLGEGTLVSS